VRNLAREPAVRAVTAKVDPGDMPSFFAADLSADVL
jgi:hypothetical protein